VVTLEPISSFETLQKSIRYDFYTRRWFHYLIGSGRIQDVFRRDLAIHVKSCATYRNWSRAADAVFLGTFVLAALSWVSRNPFLFLFAGGLFIAFQAIAYLQKQRLIFLASLVLKNHFSPEDFRMMSLFQIAEQLSRRYGVLSLVDAISMSDNCLRKLFLAGYLLPWPDVGRSLLIFCLVYLSCKYALNTAVVYEGIRLRQQRPLSPRLAG